MKNIDIHIDFSCPFSYLGGENFIQFIESNDLSQEVKPNFVSFRLSPNKDNLNTEFLKNMMIKFRKNSIDETRAAYKSIEQMGKQLGLNYDVEKVVDTNSLLAHQGLQFVKEQGGSQSDYFRAVMKAHWEQGLDFSSQDVIKPSLKSLNTDTDLFIQNLDAYNTKINKDVSLAKTRGVNSFPTFVYHNKKFSGVGSSQEFRKLVD